MKAFYLLPAVWVLILAAGCSGPEGYESPSGSAAAGKEALEWDALRGLDELAVEAERVPEGDEAALRAAASKLKAQIATLTGGEIPAGVENPERTELLLNDLRGLMDAMGDTSATETAALRGAVGAVHPIVEQLMEASGVPHVHDHGDNHDHDHEDDHDHEEDH